MRISNSCVQCAADAPTPRNRTTKWRSALTSITLLTCAAAVTAAQAQEAFLPSPVRSVSTVPGNGDVNPYGVAFVTSSFQTGSGVLLPGDILVSNYNNSSNLQGTGTTITRIPATGSPTVFYQGSAGLGLSTALGLLRRGYVLVGNSPTMDGTSATAGAGSLLVLNSSGQLVQTFWGPSIQGPWDMTVIDNGTEADVFISNALTGTVTRLLFSVKYTGLYLVNTFKIASGYVHRGDPVTLFVAPTGLVYDPVQNLLYVASTGDNAVYAISDPVTRTTDGGKGVVIYRDNAHLHGPLGLAWAPNGHLLVTNNDGINPDSNQPSEIVEFTTAGEFVKEIPVDPAQGGSFGLAVNSGPTWATLAAVDDNTATLTIWTLNIP